MKRAWGLAAAGALSLLASAAAPTLAQDPHAFGSDRRRCASCHGEVPRKGAKIRVTRDVVSLCLDCHFEKDLSALHPVDVRPGAKVPGDLPLDERGAITCATCHDLHGSARSGQPYVAQPLYEKLLSVFSRGDRRYSTFYLRRRNDKGQLCLGCHEKASLAAEPFHVKEASVLDQYVGSDACKSCHPEAYAQWRKTPHARMVRDARRDPRAVAADFSGKAPFAREAVVYALGAHWTQRYVVEKGGRLFVKGAVWSLDKATWDTSGSLDKPWAEYCQGCHTTGFEMRDQPRQAELGIGCEACHGPGRVHVSSRGRGTIINPATFDETRRAMICESCHTTGHDRSGQFRFPLGYRPGRDLTRFYRGLLPKPGQDNVSFTGDESYADRRRQWLFWVDSFMDARNQACEVCRDFRSQRAKAKPKVKMTPSELCLSCHRSDVPADDLHRRHADASVPCHQCHVPLQSGGSYSVHDHKFFFAKPDARPAASPSETCGRCHRRRVARAGG